MQGPPEEPASTAGLGARLPFFTWLLEGVRAGFLLAPRVGGAQPAPWQMAALVALLSAIEIALGRLEVAGDAVFDLRGWLAPWWSTAVLALVAWWGLSQREDETAQPAGLAAWLVLWLAALLPANVVSQLLGIAQERDLLPDVFTDSEWLGWAVYWALWAWGIAVAVRLFQRFGVRHVRLAALAGAMIAVFALSASLFPDRPWQAPDAQLAQQAEPALKLSQAVIESQQDALRRTLEDIAPHREGIVDVYGIVFSPYADEEVFLRESTMVAKVLADRFDAQGRVVQLANNPDTAGTLAWATPENLDRAIDAVAAKMDRENDVLVVYMTSHGASDFKLAASNPPLEVDPVSPGDLRRALDKAGVRNRVIAVSACYSGGWVGPLASETTLVMTAADADHTSYGCGRLSELTFFGRAVFDEQLRHTHSFESAFTAAVPVIRQREVEGKKPDGFSNPQLSVGDRIRPVLRELEQRLDTQAH